MTSLLFANPEIDGILSLGGALSAGAILAMDKQGRDMVPITGENARQFLELWKEKGLKSWATMQPNWLGAFATYVAVQALEGKDVPAFVKIPLPIIDNSNIDEYLARAADFPADGYIYSPYDQALFDKLLAAEVAPGRLQHVAAVPLLAARGVSKSFFGNPVLRDVSISLLPGRIHALLGENGAGQVDPDQPPLRRAAAGWRHDRDRRQRRRAHDACRGAARRHRRRAAGAQPHRQPVDRREYRARRLSAALRPDRLSRRWHDGHKAACDLVGLNEPLSTAGRRSCRSAGGRWSRSPRRSIASRAS